MYAVGSPAPFIASNVDQMAGRRCSVGLLWAVQAATHKREPQVGICIKLQADLNARKRADLRVRITDRFLGAEKRTDFGCRNADPVLGPTSEPIYGPEARRVSASAVRLYALALDVQSVADASGPDVVICSAPEIGPLFGTQNRSVLRTRSSVRFSEPKVGPFFNKKLVHSSARQAYVSFALEWRPVRHPR